MYSSNGSKVITKTISLIFNIWSILSITDRTEYCFDIQVKLPGACKIFQFYSTKTAIWFVNLVTHINKSHLKYTSAFNLSLSMLIILIFGCYHYFQRYYCPTESYLNVLFTTFRLVIASYIDMNKHTDWNISWTDSDNLQ